MTAVPPGSQGGLPLLHAAAARVAIDDVTAISCLDFTSRGARVVVSGDTGALFAALLGVPAGVGSEEESAPLGEARVVGGTLRVAGRDVATDAHFAISGAAPLDPRLPPGFTAEDYVGWSARLAGLPARLAKELAPMALARVGLAGARKRALATLALPERRALILAHAIVASPEVVIAEAPLAGLDGAGAELVMNALASATEGRGSIISVKRLDPGTAEGTLARAATDVAVLSSGELMLEGPPGEALACARLYAVTVRSNVEALRAELAARGIELRGASLRCALALPADRTTTDVLAAAACARAAIVELIPLFG